MQVRLTKTLISIKIDIRFGSVTFGKSIEVSTKKTTEKSKKSDLTENLTYSLRNWSVTPYARNIHITCFFN